MISPLENCPNIRGDQAIGLQFYEPQFPMNFTFSVKPIMPYRPSQIENSRGTVPSAVLGSAEHRTSGENLNDCNLAPELPLPLPSSSDSCVVSPLRYSMNRSSGARILFGGSGG